LKGDAAFYLAAALRTLGRPAEADAWAQRAQTLYQQTMPAESARQRAALWLP
jgi:hypothetical protein